MTVASAPFHAPRTLRAAGRVTFEGPNTVRKQGTWWRIQREVEAMEYVRHHTSIPIPAIIEVHSDTDDEKPQGWMLMERLPGVELGVAWPKMSEDARTETIKQLRSYFEQLHRLRPEGAGWIGSCSGGPAYDHRLDNQFTRGPFPTVSDFHDSLVAPLKEFPRPEWASKYRDQLPDSHDIRTCEKGILGWEMAGFWPAWWEYRKALFGSRSRPWWVHVLREVMAEYPRETEATILLKPVGKSGEVVGLLRHLAYIWSYGDGEISYAAAICAFIDWPDWANDLAQQRSDGKGLNLLSEDPLFTDDALAYVVGLTSNGDTFEVYLLDTQLDVMYLTECSKKVMYNPPVKPILDDAYDYVPKNEADWWAEGMCWAIPDFFEMLKWRFRELHSVPVSRHTVLSPWTNWRSGHKA